MIVQGPYHYQGDCHQSFNVWDDHGIVATVYAYDGDIEAAKLRADRFAASPLLLALLREAYQPVAEREYLESVEFYYGSGWSEPSPAEWGIHVGYQQTIDAMPHAQFLEEVEAFHRTNREEDDGSGEFLTLANRIRAAISAAEGNPS